MLAAGLATHRQLEGAAGQTALAEALEGFQPEFPACVVAPADPLAILGQFQGVADAGRVGAIHVPADLRAEHRAQGRADNDGNLIAVTLADLAADGAPHHATQDRAYRLPVAGSGQDAVIPVPFLAGIAQVFRVVLLAPAVGRGMGGRGGPGGHGEQER